MGWSGRRDLAKIPVRMNPRNFSISHLAERTGHKLLCACFCLVPMQFFLSSRESLALTAMTAGLVVVLGLLSLLVRNPRMFMLGMAALGLSFAGVH